MLPGCLGRARLLAGHSLPRGGLGGKIALSAGTSSRWKELALSVEGALARVRIRLGCLWVSHRGCGWTLREVSLSASVREFSARGAASVGVLCHSAWGCVRAVGCPALVGPMPVCLLDPRVVFLPPPIQTGRRPVSRKGSWSVERGGFPSGVAAQCLPPALSRPFFFSGAWVSGLELLGVWYFGRRQPP